MTDLRLMEMSFAYERAAGVIESECRVIPAGEFDNGWYDLGSASQDLDDEIEYLDSRRLLERHPEDALWVTIRDENEPLPETAHDV